MELWNPRLVWIGKDLKAHLIPYPAVGRDTFHYPRLVQHGLECFQQWGRMFMKLQPGLVINNLVAKPLTISTSESPSEA